MQNTEQKYFDAVASELAQKILKPGLWARAIAEAGSEDGKARAYYIRLRVAELKEEKAVVSAAPETTAISSGEEVSQVRPWVRYSARMVDVSLFVFVVGLLNGLFGRFLPEDFTKSGYVQSMIYLFCWCFVEAFLLSVWGTTPGKALLRVSICTARGDKLDYRAALSRSFSVWFRGLGAGIPLVSLFTLFVAYDTLTKEHITSWDSASGTAIRHKKVGAVRTVIVVMFFIGFAYLLFREKNA